MSLTQCHDKQKTVGERINCYREAKRLIKEACFHRNEYGEEVKETTQVIMEKIDTMYRQKYDVDNAALVATNVKLHTIQSLINELKPKVTQHAQNLSAFSKRIRDEVIPGFEPFKQNLVNKVDTAANITSSTALTQLMSEIHHLMVAELQQTQSELSKLAMLRFTSEQIARNAFDVFAPYQAFMEENGLKIPLNFDTKTLDNMETYLTQRYDTVQSQEQQVSTSLDKKLQALLHHEAQVALTNNVQTAMLLRRKTQYLQEVQVVVDAFKNPPTSTFNRIIYYAPYWQHAQSLQDIITYCDSSEVSHWQSLGCHRAQAYRQNVTRAINSNIPYGILFGLRALASLGDQSPQPDLQQHITQLIGQKRTQEAAQFFDGLLKEAEEIAQ